MKFPEDPGQHHDLAMFILTSTGLNPRTLNTNGKNYKTQRSKQSKHLAYILCNVM